MAQCLSQRQTHWAEQAPRNSHKDEEWWTMQRHTAIRQ